MSLLRKLKNAYIWKRIAYERLTEPVHLNLASVFVALFGSLRTKIAFDLVLRQQHAYAILACADLAKRQGVEEVTLVEFGVAAGAGLMNICRVADAVTKATGVRFRVVGFDTGAGMPPPKSYKDHPDLYQEGDFPMNFDALKASLPANCELILGDVALTVRDFVGSVKASAPIGFISIDVDYYSSTVDALKVLDGEPTRYLPRVQVYLDDLEDQSHNSWCGELAAVHEFNDHHELRKIEPHAFLRSYRLFRNARWIEHMMQAHILDHPVRVTATTDKPQTVLVNTYLPRRA